MVSEDTAVVKTPFVSTWAFMLFNSHWTVLLRCPVSSLRCETTLNNFLTEKANARCFPLATNDPEQH